MKELYIAPEAKLMSFAPVENLASDTVNFDNFFNLGVNFETSGVSNNTPLAEDVDTPA